MSNAYEVRKVGDDRYSLILYDMRDPEDAAVEFCRQMFNRGEGQAEDGGVVVVKRVDTGNEVRMSISVQMVPEFYAELDEEDEA